MADDTRERVAVNNPPPYDNETSVNHISTQNCKKKVAYIYNEEYLKKCDLLPKIQGRATIVHELIKSYGLLGKMSLISPALAKTEDILLFHSSEYIECLQKLSNEDDDEKWLEEAEAFGLTYDCPAYPGVYETASYITGASIKAAQAILTGYANIAINWQGGWHHAKRDEASGYCYINDIVIAILKLRERFDRVLYIDLDLHHGDGVEDAFCATSKVMTVSFHKFSPGFFPGTGDITDLGVGKGRFHTVNIPLLDGIKDEIFVPFVQRVLSVVCQSFLPEAVVCQCGADGLDGDPMSSFNLSTGALVNCVKFIASWNVPLLLLGGGGYNLANTARCWTSITGAVLQEDLPSDIPEHTFFTMYGPDYQLSTDPGNRRDKNDISNLKQIIYSVKENLSQIQ